MELLFFGINVLLIIVIWHFMLRPSILDHFRDKLFDLRDELRATFVKNDWALSLPVYKRLRDLLNGHLRFIEDMSLLRMSYVKACVAKDKELLDYVQRRNSRLFATADAEQQKFVEYLRKCSVAIAMDHSIYSSGLLVILFFAMFPFVCAWKFLDMLNRQVTTTASAWGNKGRHLGRYMNVGISVTRELLAKKLMQRDFVENYSVERGMA